MTPESSIWALDRTRLSGTRFTDVRFFDEIGSTNSELLAEARRGGPEGVVAVADHQTAGRGRLDRTWSAAPGAALLVSVLLRPSLPPAAMPLVAMAAGLAAVDAVDLAAGFRPGLKWPNDLVVPGAAGDRKLAGMLSETTTGGPETSLVTETPLVIGIGFNVAPGAYPEELAGQAISCEEVAGHPVARVELLVCFLRALEQRYRAVVAEDARDRVVAAYRADSSTLGRRVRVETPAGVIEGVADDLAWNGQLVVVDDAGGRTVVSAGDVVHLRPA